MIIDLANILAADSSAVQDQSALTFVEDVEYVFIGGGAASTNGY